MAAFGVLAKLLRGASKAGKGASGMGAPLRLAGSAPGLKQAATQVAKTAAKTAAKPKGPVRRMAGGLMGALTSPAGQVTGLGLSVGLPVAGMIAGARSGVIDDLTVQGRGLSGSYDKGPLGAFNLLGLPSDEALDARRTNYLQRELAGEMSLLQRGGLGDQAVIDPSKSLAQNRALMAGLADEAQFNIDEKRSKRDYFGDIATLERERLDADKEANRNMVQLQLNQAHQARMDELGARIDSRVGEQDLARLQLTMAQEGNREKMDIYRQELSQKAQNDRYRTTAGLIQGLSQLGAAFAL